LGVLGEYPFQKGERKIVEAHLLQLDEPIVVFGDRHTIEDFAIYFGFRPPPHMGFRHYTELDLSQKEEGVRWVILINQMKVSHVHDTFPDEVIPEWVWDPPSNWKLIEEQADVFFMGSGG